MEEVEYSYVVVKQKPRRVDCTVTSVCGSCALSQPENLLICIVRVFYGKQRKCVACLLPCLGQIATETYTSSQENGKTMGRERRSGCTRTSRALLIGCLTIE